MPEADITRDFRERRRKLIMTSTNSTSQANKHKDINALCQWNQYNTALEKFHRTNNGQRGGLDRFYIVVGKNHSSLYYTFNGDTKGASSYENLRDRAGSRQTSEICSV